MNRIAGSCVKLARAMVFVLLIPIAVLLGVYSQWRLRRAIKRYIRSSGLDPRGEWTVVVRVHHPTGPEPGEGANEVLPLDSEWAPRARSGKTGEGPEPEPAKGSDTHLESQTAHSGEEVSIDGPCELCAFEGCELQRNLGADRRTCFIPRERVPEGGERVG